MLTQACNVCSGSAYFSFSQEILGKYSCSYFFCENCGFLQTEKPYWLGEAYSSAISDPDTGLLQRNIQTAKIVSALLFYFFPRHKKYLDKAGGYGILTRLMRDIGYDYHWSDAHCENLFAKGFEDAGNTSYSVVTAFEVLEHLEKPVEFISAALSTSDQSTLICSTQLFERSPPDPVTWWYYAPSTGQHIAFYQRKTLEFIASRLGVRIYSNGSFHLFTKKRIHPLLFKIAADPRAASLLALVPAFTMKSRTMRDHQLAADTATRPPRTDARL